MSSKTNMTPDEHVQFGDSDNYTEAGLPPAFNPGGDAEFTPGWFGRVMVNPSDSGFGAAYIPPDED